MLMWVMLLTGMLLAVFAPPRPILRAGQRLPSGNSTTLPQATRISGCLAGREPARRRAATCLRSPQAPSRQAPCKDRRSQARGSVASRRRTPTEGAGESQACGRARGRAFRRVSPPPRALMRPLLRAVGVSSHSASPCRGGKGRTAAPTSPRRMRSSSSARAWRQPTPRGARRRATGGLRARLFVPIARRPSEASAGRRRPPPPGRG
eukprot:scaffold429_cov321-Prasinococcus_capsulatus_cf.AAC.7